MTLESAVRALELANAKAEALHGALDRRIEYIDRVGGFMSGGDQQAHRYDRAILETYRPIAVPRTKTANGR